VKNIAHGSTDKQSVELCDSVGKMLVTELDSAAVKGKVEKLVADYVKKNKIDVNAASLNDKLEWHVKVSIKK
jgi:hypothetical protein